MDANMSSRELLKLVESFGLTATWGWNFKSNHHFWSPGMYRILGLPLSLTPHYDVLLDLVHQDDKEFLPTGTDLTLTGILAEQTVRILRPDRSMRTIVMKTDVLFSLEGRPERVTGAIVDVSERETLARGQQAERRRKRIIFEQLKTFTSTTAIYPFKDFSAEWVELVGLPKAELLEAPLLPVIKAERALWGDSGREAYLAGKIVHTRPRLHLAGGTIAQYRMMMVPMLDGSGGVESWTNFVGPITLERSTSTRLREALDQRLESAHIRAARALLDWSMTDLARASGLSLSTIRRIEDAGGMVGGSSMDAIATALRSNGVRFTLMDDATIMLGKL